MSKRNQPPFKRGEWVHTSAGMEQVVRCYFVGVSDMGCYWVRTKSADDYASVTRLATARELRAESKRLAKRAAELSAAADAVEAKKAGKR